MSKILLVEDDIDLCTVLESFLRFERYNVDSSYTGADAQTLIDTYPYDGIILDLALPDTDGLEILNRFRMRGGDAPVLILTGRISMQHKQEGFDSGCDDYLTKPFEIRELILRLRALLRRPAQILGYVLKVASLALNTRTHEVFRGEEPIKLHPQEFAMLEYFMRHPDSIVSPDTIIDHVWESTAAPGPQTFRTSLKRLRKQIDIEGAPSFIENVHGVGYRLVGPVSRH